MTSHRPAVVLLSGGLDSSVLLHHVARELHCPEIHALSFNYGQRHSRELVCATAQARAARSMAEQVQLLEDVAHTAFTVMVPHLLPRILAGMAGLRGLTVMAEKLSEIDPTITGQTALEVTRGLPHNVTTEMDLSLWIVAQVVQDDPASAARFATGDAPALAAEYLARTLPYPAQAAIAGFMDRYGMRGLAEIDFGRPRWRYSQPR